MASTYVLRPCPRTGCPDFGMDQKGVMGQSVMGQSVMGRSVMGRSVTERRCDGAESRVLGQMSAEARLIKRKIRIDKWAKLIFRLRSKLWSRKTFYAKGDGYLWSSK